MTRCGAPWTGSGPTAMSKPVAIVAAMQRRARCPDCAEPSKRQCDGVELYELAVCAGGNRWHGHVTPGRGRLRLLCARLNPLLLVSAGLAGALTPSLKVGDVVRAREVVDEATGERYTTVGGDAVLVTALRVAGARRSAVGGELFGVSGRYGRGRRSPRIAKQHGIPFSWR